MKAIQNIISDIILSFPVIFYTTTYMKLEKLIVSLTEPGMGVPTLSKFRA